MDRFGFAFLTATAIAFFTVPVLVVGLGHPLFVLALGTISGATVALAVPVATARNDGGALPLHGRGLAAVALMAVGATVTLVGHTVVRPRTMTHDFKENAEQALFSRAFATGNLTALAGCWRAGPWSNANGFRELCFSGRSTVTVAEDLRFNNGAVQQCLPRPGVDFAGVEGGSLRIEAPQTATDACVTQLGRRGFVRTRIDCKPIPGTRQQLECGYSFAAWGNPAQITTREQMRFTLSTAPRPVLPPIPGPAPPTTAPRPPPPPSPPPSARPIPDPLAPSARSRPAAPIPKEEVPHNLPFRVPYRDPHAQPSWW